MADKSPKKQVEECKKLYEAYKQRREPWATQAKEDKEFRMGKQWTKEQMKVLKSRGQAPIVVNRLHPAVETAKAMLTANRPSFRCSPREDSDRKVANVMSNLLSYVYDISDGRNVVRNAIDDYYVAGLGYIMAYQDPMADNGKGEVKFKDLDPFDVYVDPNSRDRLFDDAESIIVSRLFTQDQANQMYPNYEKKIKNAGGSYDDNRPITNRTSDTDIQFPEDVGQMPEKNYVRGFERYYKTTVEKYRVFEKFSGKESLMNEEEYLGTYLAKVAYSVQGKIVADETSARGLVEQAKQQIMQQHQQKSQQMQQQGYDPETIPKPQAPPQVEQIPYIELVKTGHISAVAVTVRRICQSVIIGDTLLYSRILPCEYYPIIPICNVHTRTPYPVSDIRMVKGMQEFINKTRSLIIAHATTSTNTKILVPEGSVDMNDFENKWAQPGVAIPYDPTDGPPVPIQPTPLPNELYHNENTAKSDIDHCLGLYEMMMGNASAAPQTYKATISLDEFGQRKIKSKLADIESSLTRLGVVCISLIQQLYTQEKIFRLVNPNNSMNEYVINKRLYDDKSGETHVINDMTRGKYDVIVVAGSTLPSNRYAELEFYMDAYSKGIVDKTEVLKKTEVFDMEGVLKRTDAVGQLQGQLKQAQQEIKKLRGDLQTRDRESVNLRKKVEVEKFKTSLDKTQNKAESASRVYEKRLDDELRNIKKDIGTGQKALANDNKS